MIIVNNDYVIEVDTLNYTAKRDCHRKTVRKNPTTGEEFEVDSYVTVGYFTTLAGALKGIIEDMNKRKLKEGVLELEEALSIVLKNNRDFSALLERVLEA